MKRLQTGGGEGGTGGLRQGWGKRKKGLVGHRVEKNGGGGTVDMMVCFLKVRFGRSGINFIGVGVRGRRNSDWEGDFGDRA